MIKINTHYFYDPSLIGENPLIIEVGLWTIENLQFINSNHPNCRLRAFEAEPDNFAQLEKNNILPNLKVYHKALGWYSGSTKFYKYAFPAWHSMYPKHDIDNRELKEVIEVDTITIDDIATEEIDLLLLNCEGCEVPVLDRLTSSIEVRSKIKQIATSFHDRKCYDYEIKKNYLTLMNKYYHIHENTDNEVPYYLFIRK